MSATLDTKRRTSYPTYPSIIPGGLWVLINRLLGRRMRMGPFARRMVQRVSPPVECLGADNIPQNGGYVVTVNHYAREGFSSAWIAIGVSGLLPHEVTWVMTEEWVFQGHPLAFALRPAMRYVLLNLQKALEFLPMPTMAPGYSDTTQRAAGVRRTIEYARMHPQAVIGISPEGRDAPQPGMGELPNGVGKFILHLNGMGRPILPVAITEHHGQLSVHFGEPYDLHLTDDKGSLDEQARAIIHAQINRLLS